MNSPLSQAMPSVYSIVVDAGTGNGNMDLGNVEMETQLEVRGSVSGLQSNLASINQEYVSDNGALRFFLSHSSSSFASFCYGSISNLGLQSFWAFQCAFDRSEWQKNVYS
ncbi:MAG: hypothetical protein R3A11_02270 [Bdellovibrionota bacterium]